MTTRNSSWKVFAAIAVVGMLPVAQADFYRVAQDGSGAWRLTGPDGRPTVWLGVDHVKFNGFRCEAEDNRMHYREANIKKFGTRAAWASNTVERLRGWGFNALGAGCDNVDFRGSGLGRAVFLALGDSATSDDENDHEHYLAKNLHTPGTAFPNVFNPDFADQCDRAAAKACTANRDDPEVLGYFIDNELAWEGRNRGATRPWGLFDAACAKPQGNTARKAVESFLSKRGLKIGDDIPIAVKQEFVGVIAEKYFSATAAAIRKHDPNHLVLGCRFAGSIVPDVVWQKAGRHCDIVTLNAYARAELEKGEVLFWYQDRYLPIGEALAKISELAGKPLMLTEWSFPAFDSGLLCRNGAGQRFDTQIERAWASELYAKKVLSLPCVVGYDYFMWVDMPAKGISRKFPEDTNYGLVREDGTEYRELTEALAKVQRCAMGEHARQEGTRFVPDTKNNLADIYDPVTNSVARLPSFSFFNGMYCVKNAAGLELHGIVGGNMPVERIVFGGKDFGKLSAMIQTQGAYNPKSRSGYNIASHKVKGVLGVDWHEADGRGFLSLKCDVGVAMIDLEIAVAPESRNFIAEVKGVANTGETPLAVDKVLLLPYAPFTNVVESAKRPTPSQMAMAHCACAWLDRGTGRYLGVVTDSTFVEEIDFWTDKSGGRHPDVCFSPVRPAHGGRFVVEPGSVRMMKAPLHALIRAGEGGAVDWNKFSRRVPRVAVSVDFARTAKKIKPVHGVGQPPFFGRNYKLLPCLRDAHIPYSRLHDVGGAVSGQGIYVDIPNLFKDFDADPENPASYSFAFTDDLLHALVTNGVAPYFRLGVSIENYVVDLGPRNILPPKDNLKWAKICEGVVRHYTEGWANGFKWKIDYWEIWNEPDGEEPPESNAMWRGTFKQYLDLYGTAQKYLKAKFPHLQFGAYGSCGFSSLCSNWKPERAAHHMKCFNDFLEYIRENNCPPDFFSFHCYGPWRHIEKQANHARRELDKAGLKHVPIHLTEWLSSHGVGTARQAAIIADTLVRLQSSAVDLAAIYDARCGSGVYSPLFDPAKWAPRKAYYAFRSFGDLYALGTEVPVACSDKKVAALAATGQDGEAAMMVVNPTDMALPFISDFGGRCVKSVRLTDETHDWSETKIPSVLTPYSIWLFSLSAGRPPCADDVHVSQPCEATALQSAIDKVSAAGGGTVHVAPGDYPVAFLELKSGVTLDLAKGARLYAETNALLALAKHCVHEHDQDNALVVSRGAKDVAIVGGGEIDGLGESFRPTSNNLPGRWKLLVFQDTEGIRIEGVTLRDSASWTCFFQRCRGIVVRRTRVDGHANYNNDGFDIEASDVLIEDCDIDCEDDAICGKVHDAAFVSENVEVRNCRIASNCNFIKLGTASYGDFRNWRVHDCVLERCRAAPLEELQWFKRGVWGVTDSISGISGICLEAVDGGRIEDVVVSDIEMRSGVQTPIFLRVGARHGKDGEWSMRNVTIERVKGVSCSWIASSITGVPGRRIGGGIVLRDIDLVLKGGISGVDWNAPVPEKEKSYPENRCFGTPLPAYGFYLRHADGVEFENVRLSCTGGPDGRPPVVAEDCTGVALETER